MNKSIENHTDEHKTRTRKKVTMNKKKREQTYKEHMNKEKSEETHRTYKQLETKNKDTHIK